MNRDDLIQYIRDEATPEELNNINKFVKLHKPENIDGRFFKIKGNCKEYVYVIESKKYSKNEYDLIRSVRVIDGNVRDQEIFYDTDKLVGYERRLIHYNLHGYSLNFRYYEEISKEEFIELYKKVSNEILNNIAGLL